MKLVEPRSRRGWKAGDISAVKNEFGELRAAGIARLAGGADFPVLRAAIVEEKPSGRSLMPEGMETVPKPQDVADVIAWLRAK